MLNIRCKQNFNGTSFNGQNLEGSDFSHSRLAGASFKNTILRNSNFMDVRCGIQWPIIIVHGIGLFALVFVSGFLMGTAIPRMTSFYRFCDIFELCTVYLPLIFLLASGIVLTIRLGKIFVLIKWLILLVVLYIALAPIIGIFIWLKDLDNWVLINIVWTLSWAVVCIFLSVVAGTLIGSLSISGKRARTLAASGILLVLGTGILSGTVGAFYREAGTELIQMFTFPEIIIWREGGKYVAGHILVTMVLFIAIVGYIARRTQIEDPQFAQLKRFFLWIWTLGGTCFKAADLNEANFSGAWLAGASFTGAVNLDRINWRNAQGLNATRLAGTILEEPTVRDVLVTGTAEGCCFRGLRLEGAYLRQASLANADFNEANLSRTDLRGADLSGANLANTDLRGTDLSNAILTGVGVRIPS